jgi:hypothetical protein
MAISIKVCKDEVEWEKLLGNASFGTIFHTWKFLKIIEKYTNTKLHPLIGIDGSTPVGLFPLFYRKRFSVRTVFSPPARVAVPYLGPALLDYEKVKQSKRESMLLEFQRAAGEYIFTDLHSDYFSVSTSPGLIDARPFIWSDYTVELFYDYLIDMTPGMEVVWDGLKKNLRKNISKERTRGLVFREGGVSDLEYLHGCMIRRYEKQELEVKVPLPYLKELFSTLGPENMKVLIVEYKQEPLGGLIDLFYKDTAWSWIGNPKGVVETINSTDFLQWEAINHAFKAGYKYYNEVGANTERLCKFKSKFNPKLMIRYSAKKYNLRGQIAEKAYLALQSYYKLGFK